MKRMRVFAGPNGSGKSTMVNDVIEKGHLQYGRTLINPNRHINPDDLNSLDVLDFGKFGLTVEINCFRDSILKSPFFKGCNIKIEDIAINNNCFTIPGRNSYLGSMLADYLRDCYIDSDEELFSFETVFSHPSKVDFLKSAKERGWQVYLYFVSTADPCINYDRVKDRVLKGGHDVPGDKVIERYTRSLENLYPALQHCRRAYIYDNTEDMQLIAEKYPDGTLELYGNSTPAWLYDYVLSKCRTSA